MHRNTFINAPACLDETLALRQEERIRFAGQITGTEGYTEAIATGLVAGLAVCAARAGKRLAPLPSTTVLGALIAYATSSATKDYQPMHVNFGIIDPLDPVERSPAPGKNSAHTPKLSKRDRYRMYACRSARDLDAWCRMYGAEIGLDTTTVTELDWGS